MFILNIPAMNVPSALHAVSTSKGGNNYVTKFTDTTKEDYETYLSELENWGFQKFADNGKGIDEAVFCTTMTRGDLVLNVTYFSRTNMTSVSVYEGPVSERLIYKDAYVEGNIEGAKTKLHMLELWRLGNSFVIQLKNGHFILSDGGLASDLPYLLDYLEGLAPNGEKPVIEAWFITHAHGDHCGSLVAFCDNQEWLERITVEGVYFSEPSDRVFKRCGGDIPSARIKWVTNRFRTCEGEATTLYRPQTGQRYYFNDITIDILLAQEQLMIEDFKSDLNTSSTVSMITIEGQKCFFSGDIHQPGLEFIMNNVSREYLTLDLFTLNHHGFNTSISFVDYVKIKTLMVTLQHTLPIRMIRETRYMISKAEESMMWGDGTKILTFPYKIGTYETLPCKEWIYHGDAERILQQNIYTFPNRRLKGFLFNADEVLLENGQAKQGVMKFLEHLKQNEVHMSVYSSKTTDELTKELECAEMKDFFELIMGAEGLSEEDPHADASRKSEAQFQLDNVHKYVVVCKSLDVVRSIVCEGIRTLVVTDGEEVSKEMNLKCWKRINTFDDVYELFDQLRILYE